MKLWSASRAARYTVAMCVLLGLEPSYAQRGPEQVMYHGVALAVDERISAGGDLLKVVLVGEAFLVLTADAPHQVVLRYLANPEMSARLSGEVVVAIVTAAAQHGDADVVKAAVQLGLTRTDSQAFDSSDLWQRLVANAGMEAVVWSVVQGVADTAPVGRVCAASAAVETKVLAQGQVAGALSDQVALRCIDQAIAEALHRVWSGRVGPALVADLQRESAPFLRRRADRSDSVAQVERVLAGLVGALEQVDSARFEHSLEALQKKSEEVGVQPDAAPARQLFIDRAIAAGAFRVAIEQLSKVPFEQRSSATHAQLVGALRGLPSVDWAVLVDSSVRPAIVRYVAKDEEFYSQWITTHRRVVLDRIAARNADAAWSLAEALRQEDPTVAAQVLSKTAHAIVQGYLDDGSIAKAEQVASQLRPWLSWTTRFRVSLARLGLTVSGLCGMLLAVGVLLMLLWRRGRRREASGTGDGSAAAQPAGGAASSEPARSGEQSSGHGGDEVVVERAPYTAEYVASLRLFGLQPGATLAQIKNAYRTAVKQYHPDRSGGGAAGDADLFIRLTSEYEKLLELHEREAHEQRHSEGIS